MSIPRLSVLDTNARAIALYRRMGWKFEQAKKNMEFDLRDILLL